jgi:hypothetical protein
MELRNRIVGLRQQAQESHHALLRHSNTRNHSELCIIITLAYTLYSF